ncbi:hypothetical protein [Chitinilyticum piscinae]|uniref:CopL family metal-binding regulatory protein n=1 Tax=Chitinilyticum piscinae TaxID=2866724 RepID=A0A8J7KE80_9NEIS|nr:hypothetical protein [Chitinilyticum piscinae]MBE9609189.1 hypothetical protein [Chitinilyticum piscinae]
MRRLTLSLLLLFCLSLFSAGAAALRLPAEPPLQASQLQGPKQSEHCSGHAESAPLQKPAAQADSHCAAAGDCLQQCLAHCLPAVALAPLAPALRVAAVAPRFLPDYRLAMVYPPAAPPPRLRLQS